MQQFLKETDKFAIYLRKSREDLDREAKGEHETLKRHRDILTAHAARMGMFVAQVYEEIVSGETISARPQIQKLIAGCYEGKYKGILVVEVTRLSRGNQGDAQQILDVLKFGNRNNGVLVVTPTKVYDVAHNADDEEYMEFELFMSRREYKMIQKRLERGRRQAVVEGNYMASYRLYGYNIVKTKTGRTLEPNQEEAPIVKMIFDWTVKDNMTPGKIAARLTSMGVPTYTGAPEWSLSTIKTILANPTYIGKVKWNDRMVVKTMNNGKLVTSRPRSNHTDQYMLYDGKHKGNALIDEETFLAAQKRIPAPKTKKDLKLTNPLSGLLVCAKCGKAMRYQRYASRKNTTPRFLHPESQLCKVKSAFEHDVINAVVQSLRMYIDDFEIKIDSLPEVDESSISSQLDAMQEEIRKLEKRLSKLFDAWEDGQITNNEFAERKTVNNERIENIRRQMSEIEDSIPDKKDYEETVLRLNDALNALLDQSLTAEVKNAYLKDIIDRIEFSRENNKEFILDVYIK